MSQLNPSARLLAALSILLGSSAVVSAHEFGHDVVTYTDGNLIISRRPLIITSDVAGSHLTLPGIPAFGVDTQGVARLSVAAGEETFTCTGSLLSTGRHILTAAHCVTDGNGNLIANSITGTFNTLGGQVVTASTNITVHPNYDGDTAHGFDLAIVTLPAEVIGTVPRYDVYRDLGQEGGTHVKVGYGVTGKGDTGQSTFDGQQRAGLNEYETAGLPIGGITNRETQVTYDFDSGSAANDAFGFFFDVDDLGLGADEIGAAPGDSGGPTFVNDDGVFKIAGVTSYGLRLQFLDGTTSDADSTGPQPDSSWGEFGTDARVTHPQMLAFIDSVVPEPGAATLLAVVGTFVIARRRRRAA